MFVVKWSKINTFLKTIYNTTVDEWCSPTAYTILRQRVLCRLLKETFQRTHLENGKISNLYKLDDFSTTLY